MSSRTALCSRGEHRSPAKDNGDIFLSDSGNVIQAEFGLVRPRTVPLSDRICTAPKFSSLVGTDALGGPLFRSGTIADGHKTVDVTTSALRTVEGDGPYTVHHYECFLNLRESTSNHRPRRDAPRGCPHAPHYVGANIVRPLFHPKSFKQLSCIACHLMVELLYIGSLTNTIRTRF